MSEETKKPLIPPLSYSSMNEILGCEQKYALRKVLGAEPDSDYSQETDALDLGSVFHYCLELCEHDLNGFKVATLLKCIDDYPTLNRDAHGPLLWAMLRRYKTLHESGKLKPIAIEQELVIPKEFRGFIDVVLEEEKGIWITDIKTAAAVRSRFLSSRLASDPQLNLYVHYYNEIVKPEKPILGCRYRAVTKSRLKARKGESFKELSDRIYAGIHAYEYVIPIETMRPKETYKRFKKVRTRQHQLHKDAVPQKNLNYCESYFRPCEFWSQCHGKNFTDDFGITENIY